MSRKEINQLTAFERLRNKDINQKQAAEIIGITTRQVRKKYKRYLQNGRAGLVHKNRGVSSPKRYPEDKIEKICILYKSTYQGFGPTLFSEMLKIRHNIIISPEALRKILLKKHLWFRERTRKSYKRKRERREHVGMLVQADGSIHDWFEGRGQKCTALVGVDDATGEILFLEFHECESTKNYMLAFKSYITEHGRPIAIYVDCHSVFKLTVNNPEQTRLSQFARAMQQLEIEIIYAHSPQAKGRVERLNKTLQDRLIKLMRLHNVSDIGAANVFVKEIFIEYFNKKYSKRLLETKDFHRSFVGYDLDNIFTMQDKRQITNDYTVMCNKRVYQLEKEQIARIYPKDIVTIFEHLDGTITIQIRQTQLRFHELEPRSIKKLTPVEIVNLNREQEYDRIFSF